MDKEIKSPCCNANIDYRGGGYDEENICPLEDYCIKCGQLIAVNGFEVNDIRNPKTGKPLTKKEENER